MNSLNELKELYLELKEAFDEVKPDDEEFLEEEEDLVDEISTLENLNPVNVVQYTSAIKELSEFVGNWLPDDEEQQDIFISLIKKASKI